MKAVIISDTSCLIALFDIQELEMLNLMFDEVWVTSEVVQEFNPTLPDWISVKEVQNKTLKAGFEKLVDLGEASAIALAIETPGSRLLLDDKKGRKLAALHRLPFMGTLGLLLEAKRKGIISEVGDCLKKLKAVDFWISPELEKEVLKKAGEGLK